MTGQAELPCLAMCLCVLDDAPMAKSDVPHPELTWPKTALKDCKKIQHNVDWHRVMASDIDRRSPREFLVE
jgi:hypothetical protein